MARRRGEPPPKPPIWDRSRLGWINALGFALTLFLGLWLLLFTAANVLPDADPFELAFPTVFAAVLFLAQTATVVLGAVVVFGFMWRGADFHTHGPRMWVFFWTCAGLLFSLVQLVILLKFDWPQLPNVANFARQVYWGEAFIGLLCFGIMAYVNIDIPSEGEEHDGPWPVGEHAWDEDEDGEGDWDDPEDHA